MYVFIFTTVVIGFASAGVAMVLFRLLGRRAPKFIVPLAAAIGMFSYMIWDDYSWFDRYDARLPETVEVLQTFENPSALRPWTLISAPIERFSALDTAKSVTDPTNPARHRVSVLLIQKSHETMVVTTLVDCDTGKRAYITPDTKLDAQGFPEKVDEWYDMAPDDPLRRDVCQ
jgi:hypothetical protein